MKKQIIAFGIGISVVISGVSVYATSVLDSNIVELLRNGVFTVGQKYEEKTTVALDDASLEYKAEVGKYVGDKSVETVEKMDSIANDKIVAAKSELDIYLEQVKREVDGVVEVGISEFDGLVEKKVEEDVEKIKKDILHELEAQIKENFKKEKVE